MANNDNNDLSPRNRSNNNRNMRSSKASANNETADILKDLDLSVKKVEEVQRKKLDGEKKITAEKQKQNKEDDKQLKTQEKILKNTKETVKTYTYMGRDVGKEIENVTNGLLDSQKDFNKLALQSFNEWKKYTEKERKKENEKGELNRKRFDAESKALKNLYEQKSKYLDEEYDIKDKINSIEKILSEAKLDSEERYTSELKKQKRIYDDLIKQDNQRIKNQEILERRIRIQERKDGLKTQAFKGLGVNTDSDVFKYFSQRKSTSGEEKALLKASAKMEIASAAIETTTKAITKFATLWIGRFTSGMDRIVGVYEDTYSQVAAVTGIDEQAYAKWQNDTAKLLMDNGVNNAVTISEAMTDVARLTKDGFTDMQKASEMSIQNIQNRIINPFVDTTTDAYENLQNLFGSKFTKQITGMSGYLNQMVGSNRVFSKSIDTVIENLEPVALSAKKDLLGDSYAIAEALVKEGGMTQKQAIELVSKASNAVADPYSALMSNDVAERAAAAYGHVDNMGDFIRSYLGTASIASSGNPYAQGAALDSMGITAFTSRTDISKVMSIANNVDKLAKNSTLTPGSVYEKSLQKLANGDYTTALQEKNNIAENAATFAATLREQWPDAYEILKGILSGLGQIVMAVVGGHLFSGATNLLGGIGKGGGGLLKGFGGSAGKHAATSAGAKGASSLGAALPAAGAAAGAGLGIYNGVQAVNDFQNGEVGYGVADTVGAVTGVTAAGALGASAAASAGLITVGAAVPVVGWAALAVSGLVAGGVALAKEIDRVKESFDANKKSQEQLDAATRNWTKQAKEQLRPLENYGTLIEQTTDVETAKKLIAEAGIKSEQELQDEQYNSLDALKKLTETYIQSKRDLAEADVNLKNSIMGANQSEKTDLANFMSAIMDKGSVNDLTDAEKKLLNSYGQEAVKYIEELKEKGTLDDDINKHWKYLYDKGITDSSKYNFYDDNFSKEDYWVLTHAGNNADRRSQMQDLMTSSATSEHYYNVVAGGNGKLFTGASYRTLGAEDAAKYVRDIIDATDKSKAEEYIKKLKLGGYSTIDSLGDYAKSEVQSAMDRLGIESYAIGSNFISYDQIAQLHKGESVITAQTTSDLKEFLGTEDIKDANVTSISESVSSGLSSFSSVIADQTRALVNKIDEVIYTIKSNGTGVYTSKITDAEREEFAL